MTNRQEDYYKRYAGACRVSTRPPIQAAPPASELASRRAAFAQRLNEHADELRECYEDALAYGETHGTIVMEIVLNTDGSANPVTILSDTNRFAPLACCVLAVVRATPYDPAAAPIRFDYPFSFKTLQQPVPMYRGGAAWSRWYANPEGFQAELDATMTLAGRVQQGSAAVGGDERKASGQQSNAEADADKNAGGSQPQDPEASAPEETRFPMFPHSGPY